MNQERRAYDENWKVRKEKNRLSNLVLYRPFGKVGLNLTQVEKWVMRRDALKPSASELKK